MGFRGAAIGLQAEDRAQVLKPLGYATDTDDPTVDPRFGKVGKQTIEDTGPLTKKRMETIDDETMNAAIDFMKRQVAAKRPFFLWYNLTRMHLYTHVRPEMQGRSGISEYFDGMLEHDAISRITPNITT